MPISKGDPYGEPGDLPADGILVRSDSEAAAALYAARRDRRPFPALGLLGGDLCRTLGGGGRSGGLEGVRFTVDLGEALLDGRLHLFVAHLVARTRMWTRAFVAMNAQWRGDWNLGPRAHPNDGLLDTYDVRLPRSQLLPVRARLHHGAHLPHPGIKERRTAAVQVELERPLPVRLDGVATGKAKVISVRVQPDALTVVI
ncbi:MAG: diacylglycerol/lipid kinase family protein [Acidimicrobiales bacterium]